MSTISAGTTLTTALVNTGDTTGQLVLQTNGTTTALTIDTSQNATFVGSVTSTTHIPTGSSAPTNGLYLPAANTPAISSNSTKVLSVIKGSSLALEGATPQTGTGISFPATQSASTDANTLDDYEEGTWTPVDSSGAGLSFTSAAGIYTKVGNVVYISYQLAYPSTASGSNALIGGLPFTSKNTGAANTPSPLTTNGSTAAQSTINSNATTLEPENAATSVALKNSALSTLFIRGAGLYFTT